MKSFLLLLVFVSGCATKKSPPPQSTFADDLELQMYSDQLHQDQMNRIQAEGYLEREQIKSDYRRARRNIRSRGGF